MNLSSIRRLMPVLALALAIGPACQRQTAAPSRSQSDLGIAAYYRQDYATAYRLLRPLADQGNANAQTKLGLIYGLGLGVPEDDAAAVSWFRKAADQGHAPAQYTLGFMYGNGVGVPQDYVQAHKWFNLSESRATRADIRELATKQRDIVAARMTPQQIAERPGLPTATTTARALAPGRARSA